MKVSIIIVNYNGKHLLKECLDSVLAQSFKDFELILVDNGSSDGSVDHVVTNYSDDRIKLALSKVNLGFAGGNNLGYKYATGEYVVLLNNDTKVNEDWLKALLEAIESDENIGIVQSLVITEGVPAEYYKKNGTINLLGHNVMGFFEINAAGTGEIFQANGCSMIIRWVLVEQLGGLFPDEYFAYAEDTYFSFKVKFYGKKIMHTSGSIVYHKGNATAREQVSSMLYFYRERNRLLNFILFFPGIFQLKYLPFLIFNFWIKLLMSIFSNNYSSHGLIQAYRWIITNPKWIREHRRLLEGYEKEKPNDVLKFISGKVFNGDNIIERIANFISILYCRITRIKVFELSKL
jgi:GT2 family glycosyltransferase